MEFRILLSNNKIKQISFNSEISALIGLDLRNNTCVDEEFKYSYDWSKGNPPPQYISTQQNAEKILTDNCSEPGLIDEYIF